MAIQDSNPERRNLLVVSTAFIAFYIGGGSFPSDRVTLQVVTISFSRPDALGIFLWGMFGWFLYRYWVVHRSRFIKEFASEINEFRERPFVREHIQRETGKSLAALVGDPQQRERGFEIEWLRLYAGRIVALVIEKKLNRNEEGVIAGRGRLDDGKRITVPFTGVRGFWIAIRLLIQCVLERPSFSSYMAPYGVAFAAIVLAIGDYAL
jgi:hypothetical protein